MAIALGRSSRTARSLLRPRLRPDGSLRKARAEHNLDRRLKVYLAPKVLVVDEFGIWPYDRESATAFFTLVSARYERGSIILTSNKGFGEGANWGDNVIGRPYWTGCCTTATC